MKYGLSCVVAALTLTAATHVTAADVTGGQFELGYSTYPDISDAWKTQLLGSVEIGFTQNFAVQTDLGISNFSAIDGNNVAFTLHGVFHGSPNGSFGLYVGTEDLEDGRAKYAGVEGGFQLGTNSSIEGYLGYGDDDFDDYYQLGLQTYSALSDTTTLSVIWDYADLDSVSISRFSVRGDYQIPDGLGFYGELGSFRGDTDFGSGSEVFVGIGLTYSFGAERGTTFNSRNFTRVIPGL